MEWGDLRVFLAVARTGSLGGAARLLKQSQPTMGRRLAALEHDLGTVLFQRTTRGMVLTEEGTRVLGSAERMEAESLSLLRQVNSATREIEGTLKVASSEWFGTFVLAPLLGEFSRLYPRVGLELRTDHRFPNLDRREVDVAFRIVAFDEPDVVARRVLRLPYAVYQSRAGGSPSEIDKKARIITLTTNLSHLSDVAWFRRVLPEARVVVRSNNREVQAQLCRQGMGVAILPCALGDRFSDLERVDLGETPPFQDTWMGYHKDQSRSALIQAFTRLAVERLAPLSIHS
jgi:DNA-binding transcriptional LysR family regulator